MSQDIQSLIEQGKVHFRDQQYRKAEALFRQVLEQKKEFADVYNYLGLISHVDGQFSDAIHFFEQALAINPRYTEALLNLTILYNDMGEYGKAKKLVASSRKDARKSELAMDPFIRSKLANKHAEVGDWYYGVGGYKQAIEEYSKALSLESHYVDIRTKLAICLRELGDMKRSLEELKRATKDNPKFADAQTQLGITFYSMGKKSDARKIWKQGARKFPKNKTMKMYLNFTA